MTLNIPRENIGLDLVVIASAITICGVLSLNILLNPLMAMQFWAASNPLFAAYFYGRMRQWWDGRISDGIMCLIYCIMAVSGWWGLMHV